MSSSPALKETLMTDAEPITADQVKAGVSGAEREGLLGEPEPEGYGSTMPASAPVGDATEYGDYALELPCDEPDTRHWRHICTKEKGLAVVPPILQAAGSGENTVSNCMKLASKKYGGEKCMGSREITQCAITTKGAKKFQAWTKGDYVWQTYSAVFHQIEKTAKGLLALPGIEDKRKAGGECIAALLAETSADWMISAQGALACGMTITTVYATLGHEAMLHGLVQTECEIIFVEWSLYDTIKDTVLSKCPHLKHIIVIGEALVPTSVIGGTLAELKYGPFPTPEVAEALPAVAEAQTYSLAGIQASGSKASFDLAEFEPKTDDLALIMYTSGSTGVPKGVELTHKNFISVVASVIEQGIVVPRPGDVTVAYLPLAHILELMVEVANFAQGAAIGYAHARTLTASSPYVPRDDPGSSDLLALQPTLMAAVPAILDTIAAGLKMKVSQGPGVIAKMVFGAIDRRLGKEGAGCGCCSCLDSKLLTKVVSKLGLQNLRMMISGGAPLSAETQAFMQAVFCPVAQGYGATETAGCATVQECVPSGGREADTGGGRVGSIQPASEIKLLSVPDMGYLVTDTEPRGEVLIAGNNLARGYYKMPEKTAEDFVLHADGKVWFHTGDVGLMCADGVMKIIDRKKDLIKLSGGEYVSLGKVEAAMKQVVGVAACVVFCQSDKKECVAVISQPEKGWASVGGKPEQDELHGRIKAELARQKLARFEIPGQIRIDDFQWTPETGLVTAAFKVARNPLREHYNGAGGQLESMAYTFPEKK